MLASWNLHRVQVCLIGVSLSLALACVQATAGCEIEFAHVVNPIKTRYLGLPKNSRAPASTQPLDADIGSHCRIFVCVGNHFNDSLLADLSTYTKRGASVVRPENWQELTASLRSTPDTISHIFIDAHGTEEGVTKMPGVATFDKEHELFQSLYSIVGTLNNERYSRSIRPIRLILLQCHGASCGQAAAHWSGSVIRTSTTETSVPNSITERSLPLDGGKVKIFLPVLNP